MEQKTVHKLFLISVWIKAVAGVLETFAGVLFFFVTSTLLKDFVIFFITPELSEDPKDWVAAYLSRSLSNFSSDTAQFAGAYLFLHGLIKIFLVAGLLLGRLWAYPLSLAFLAGFIVYQSYRYTHTHSIFLVLLTIFDVVVAVLIWREYQFRKGIHVRPAH